MCFLDYLIQNGDLHKEQREAFIEYLDYELREMLDSLGIINRNKVELRWLEYKMRDKECI